MVHPLDRRHSAFWKPNVSTSERQSSRRRKSATARRVAAVSSALFLIAFGAIAGSRYEVAQNHSAGLISSTLRVPMIVQPGDSFWSLAKRYGDPNAYILDRVDVLAQANKMSAASPLMPGQRIVIPVSNPIEISRLQQNVAKN